MQALMPTPAHLPINHGQHRASFDWIQPLAELRAQWPGPGQNRMAPPPLQARPAAADFDEGSSSEVDSEEVENASSDWERDAEY